MTIKRLGTRSLLVIGTAAVALAGVVATLLLVTDRNGMDEAIRTETAPQHQGAGPAALPGGGSTRTDAAAVMLGGDPDTAVSSDHQDSAHGGAIVARTDSAKAGGGPTGSGLEPGYGGSGGQAYAGGRAQAPPGAGTSAAEEPPSAGSPSDARRWAAITGTVTEVRADARGVVLAFLVEDPAPQQPGYDKAWLQIDAQTRFVDRAGGPVSVPAASALEGRRVCVTIAGAVRESYPVQATAAEVTLL